MPKISAPTLAEHRERRRHDLLAAARGLALESGISGVTMGAVAARAGLSRPAVYEYFDSVHDLIATLAVEQLAEWGEEVATAMARAGDPEEQLRAYLRSAVAFVAAGHHRLGRALADAELPAAAADRVERSHRALVDPVAGVLARLAVRDAPRVAALVQGAVEVAARRIEDGEPADAEGRVLEEFVLGGLARLRG